MFVDRKPTRPNRYKITRENGETYYVVLERADDPTELGTPLNAATMNALVAEIEDRIPMPTTASVGQLIRVAEVDAYGKIVAVRTFDDAIITATVSEG